VRRILNLLVTLNDAGVDYVVVGGVAVVLRGHVRMTVDLDLALDLTTDNLTAALGVLKAQGLVPRLPVAPEQFADPDVRRSWVEQRNLVAFTLHDPSDALREVDLLATTPVPFSTLLTSSDIVDVDGVPVRVASVEHLMAMKRLSGRAQDLADIEALSELTSRPMVDRDEHDQG
jgi:predicted nucleotidyltransferase